MNLSYNAPHPVTNCADWKQKWAILLLCEKNYYVSYPILIEMSMENRPSDAAYRLKSCIFIEVNVLCSIGSYTLVDYTYLSTLFSVKLNYRFLLISGVDSDKKLDNVLWWLQHETRTTMYR